MLRTLALVALSASLSSGCADEPGPATTNSASTPYTPRAELPRFEVSTAPTTCPAVPTLGAEATAAQRRLSPYAAAVRRLACEPALYTLSSAALLAELGLPAEADVGFDHPRATRVILPEDTTVGDVAVAFGIVAPQVQMTWQAYHAIAHLGTNPTTGDFDLYGPGTVRFVVAMEVDNDGNDAGKEKVVAAPRDAVVRRRVHVGMSAAAVKIVADEDAVPLVVSALEQLDAHPEILSLKPGEARPRMGLGDERYRVAETSIHGETIVRGLSINPQRTVLPAAAFAAALGLADARVTNVNDEHNIWNLEVGGTTRIRWRGLELEVNIDVDQGHGRSMALDGLAVSFMTIYPAKR